MTARSPLDRLLMLLVALVLAGAPPAVRAEDDADDAETEETPDLTITRGTFSSLRARSIGPAMMSGRIGDIAVHPRKRSTWYVAASSGGVWKTTNNGTTFSPIFDSQGSYSIGCVTIDPSNPSTVWVGTGENNSQRSVSWGDGVYKSVDGGRSWKHVGLRESEHIGMIIVDPRDSDTVYVAAQGPLWRSGGDRGLYKTTDGGSTWNRVLHISDDTGINEVHFDPRNPDVLYASSYQRRRHVWTLINGGPESAIHKSTDGGRTWRKMSRGIPGGDLGRIGLDVSPVDPDVIYAIVEAQGSSSGFFRSIDRGETWQKRSGYRTSSPQYYNEIFCDPHDVDRVYLLDTVMQVTEDAGATFTSVPRRGRHVDDHALWIDPDDADHLIVGCDGGVYESWDRGNAWRFATNLPLTQFYRVAVDNAEPFYNVYGGTQDNNTQGGPSRTTDRSGISNADWFVTVGGDGFEPQVDPEDPNIVYSQSQHGGLVRFDRLSGERVGIKPRERPDDEPFRWNWDSPLIISPHDNHRLYFGANVLFRSDDMGNSWERISGDLTRQIDRDTLEVMGRIQPFDAVSKHRSTSEYGNLVALSESPLVEGLVYVGTDDGLIQVTEDDGETWRKIEAFPFVPDMTYVSFLNASLHDEDTVYAAFDNHKQGDFKPYLLKSTDRGVSWKRVSGDLPDRDVVYAVVEDHEDPDLLFAGTEFGAYFTLDGGKAWHKIGGLPTIAVRDLEIQRRENDLAMATFGRSFYILDDYAPLRAVRAGFLKKDASILPIKDALRYVPRSRGGGGSAGASYYTASNPPFGATIHYWMKSGWKSLAAKRREKTGRDPSYIPTYEELRAEDEERAPIYELVIRDEDDEEVRRLSASSSKGLHTTRWDLRHRSLGPPRGRFGGGGGALAAPGTYTVSLVRIDDGKTTVLVEPAEFEVVPLGEHSTPGDPHEAVAFQHKAARLQGAVQAAMSAAGDARTRLASIEAAIRGTPEVDLELLADVIAVEKKLDAMMIELQGDPIPRRFGDPAMPSISSRISTALFGMRGVTSAPTETMREGYRFAGEAFEGVLETLREILEDDIPKLDEALEDAGAPWTPGRIPTWKIEDD